jgi:outer membrane beta-barrel protein/carboxypeptidase family protein
MRLATPLLAALLMFPALAHAQVTSLKGKFVDPTNSAAVAGVQVKLTNFADTADVHRLTAKDDGTFEVTGLGVHSYRLEASRIGYATLRQVIRIAKQGQDAGVLQMTPEAVDIAGVSVTESPAPAIQKADTTEYRASAVKTSKDATAEDLVQKLPGVTLENGQVKAHGENVQQVLVNGKPFFGSDPAAAMRNLPAEVVDRIQVYDRASDQAEFSGFDDGQQQKTMNFILRNQKTKFGKVYGGYGDRDRYQAGGNATWLRGTTRLTVIGLSNNINQRNFSPQDLFGALSGNGGGGGGPRIMMFGGGGGRGPGGGGQQIVRMGGGFGGGGFDPGSFFVNQQGGISTTHSGGLNYVGQWSPKLSVSTSLFVNNTDNENTQSLTREYVPPQDSLAFYGQDTRTANRNGNERFDGRFEWTIDSLNSVIMQPRLYFQDNRSSNVGSAANTSVFGSPLNASNSDTRNHTQGDNLSDRLTLRHRFAKRGRNISADVQMGHSLRDGDRAQRSLDEFMQAGTSTADTLDQRTGSNGVTNSMSTRLAYTEPLVPGWQAQVTYNPQYTRSHSDARSLGLDPTGAYSLLDSAQSNTFTNRNLVQNGGAAVLYTKGVWRWLTSAAWQRTQLRSRQTFPVARDVDHAFEDVLPSMTLSATFANRRNLRLAWNTSTSPPTISQLQNVVDNSNPLALTAGNPDLRGTYNNNFSLRLSEADPFKSKSRFLFLNVARTGHPISNATFTAPSDTVVDGIALSRGTQLTRPVNLDASWNANAFAVYSRPLKLVKSIASVNGGGSFNQTPTLLNAGTNVSKTYALRYGLVLASNISQNLDFTVSYQGNYNITRNSLSTNNTGDYYSHTLGLRLNAVAKHGIVMREEVSHNLQSGVSSQYGQNVVLWNTTLGKKFLKGDTGELRLTATDVLQQDRSVGRSFTESYIQDSRDRTLGRFVQAVFTYTFK